MSTTIIQLDASAAPDQAWLATLAAATGPVVVVHTVPDDQNDHDVGPADVGRRLRSALCDAQLIGHGYVIAGRDTSGSAATIERAGVVALAGGVFVDPAALHDDVVLLTRATGGSAAMAHTVTAQLTASLAGAVAEEAAGHVATGADDLGDELVTRLLRRANLLGGEVGACAELLRRELEQRSTATTSTTAGITATTADSGSAGAGGRPPDDARNPR